MRMEDSSLPRPNYRCLECARSTGSDCASRLLLAVAGRVMPRNRDPPTPRRISPLAITEAGAVADLG
jgi:hypothetical protein